MRVDEDDVVVDINEMLKDEALDHVLWRTRFGRGDVLVVRQTMWC